MYSYTSPPKEGQGEGQGGDKFTATLFFLLVQCLTNTTVAGAALLVLLPSSSQQKGSVADSDPAAAAAKTATVVPVPVPVLDYVAAGVSYICAMLCSTEALKYVSLPMQALGKSCKMVSMSNLIQLVSPL